VRLGTRSRHQRSDNGNVARALSKEERQGTHMITRATEIYWLLTGAFEMGGPFLFPLFVPS
jgi:hypothetical protein